MSLNVINGRSVSALILVRMFLGVALCVMAVQHQHNETQDNQNTRITPRVNDSHAACCKSIKDELRLRATDSIPAILLVHALVSCHS